MSNAAEAVSRSGAGLRLLGLALGPLVLAAGLCAQTAPQPVLPPQPSPSPEPGWPEPAPLVPEPEGEAQERPKPWEYALGLGGGWDSNIDFLVPEGAGGATVVPRGSVVRALWSPRGLLRLSAKGRWIAYTDEQHQDRGYADLGLEGRYRSSPRTSWKGSASYALGHSDTSQPLLEQGLLLPLTRTHTLAGTLGLVRELGSRTALRVDGRLYGVSFEAPELIDQGSLRGTAALERRLGERSTAALEYSLEDVLSDQTGRSYVTHFGSAQWTRVLSPRAALLLEGGASHTPEAQLAGLERATNFFGGASLTFRPGRSSFEVFLRREVAPAFGTGASRLSLRAGLSAAVGLGRDWALELGANHVEPDSPASAAETYASSDDASVVLGRRLGARFRISGEASFRHRGGTPTRAALSAGQAGVFLSFAGPPLGLGQRPPTSR